MYKLYGLRPIVAVPVYARVSWASAGVERTAKSGGTHGARVAGGKTEGRLPCSPIFFRADGDRRSGRRARRRRDRVLATGVAHVVPSVRERRVGEKSRGRAERADRELVA